MSGSLDGIPPTPANSPRRSYVLIIFGPGGGLPLIRSTLSAFSPTTHPHILPPPHPHIHTSTHPHSALEARMRALLCAALMSCRASCLPLPSPPSSPPHPPYPAPIHSPLEARMRALCAVLMSCRASCRRASSILARLGSYSPAEWGCDGGMGRQWRRSIAWIAAAAASFSSTPCLLV